MQAHKLTLYPDWAALVIPGSKTKATGALYSHPSKDANGVTLHQTLQHQIEGKINIQNQKAQFIPSDAPFVYLGVHLTMDLNWKHQIQRMTCNIRQKLESLRASYASPRQTMTIIRTAIVPSLAYAFAVTPCTKADLILWDTMIGNVIKHKFKLWKSTPTAMIREDTLNFGVGAPSICVGYHRCLATALTSSLEDPLIRHRTITLNLLTSQVANIHSLTKAFLTIREGINPHIRRQLSYCMRLRQLMSIHSSKLHLIKHGESMYLKKIKTINEALSLCKPPPHTLSTLITCITKPLLSLGVNGLHNLTNRSGTHIISIAQLQSKHPEVSAKRKVALNRLAALVNLSPTTDLTTAVFHDILRNK